MTKGPERSHCKRQAGYPPATEEATQLGEEILPPEPVHPSDKRSKGAV